MSESRPKLIDADVQKLSTRHHGQAQQSVRLAEVVARLRARTAEPTDMQTQDVPAVPDERVGEQLAMFPEAVAAMPQEVARVAIFGMPSDKRGAREMLRDVQLDGRRDVTVVYTGEELGPREETLWLACLRLGRGLSMGTRVNLHVKDLLREMGQKDTGGAYGSRETLKRRLDRLSLAHLIVTTKRNGHTLRITTGLLKWGLVEGTGEIYIRLDPDGAKLFESLAYQPWEVRLAVKTDAAARLLSYVCSHQAGKPHSVLLDALRSWCGYHGQLRFWRSTCMAGLAELQAQGVISEGTMKLTSGVKGQVVSWTRAAVGLPSA
jgi:hypothetical protein